MFSYYGSSHLSAIFKISHQTSDEHCKRSEVTVIFGPWYSLYWTSSIIIQIPQHTQYDKISYQTIRWKAWYLHEWESDLESDDILSIDFTDVMFSQQAIAGGWAIFDQWGDFPILVDEAHVTRAIFVHGDGALKWPRDTHRKTSIIHMQKVLELLL